jgi:hypothetical protein
LSNLNKRNGDARSNMGEEIKSVRSRKSAYSASRESYISSRKAPSQYSEINENDEWVAIQKFNTLLHFEE